MEFADQTLAVVAAGQDVGDEMGHSDASRGGSGFDVLVYLFNGAAQDEFALTLISLSHGATLRDSGHRTRRGLAMLW
ncbi:hypothetical protein AO501_23190 [Mycobacterium gordonae]|uniref:Uncharacterized protein n=1 Tax=Mycobacterium gordonae TaxID=1778 RepID=A0A0Q2X157_MYCGO|nr:hypothetical protein AO501_23190 [Mycobacterium gordonae]